MKNIKCLLGHRRMKFKDVEENTYENDNETIKTYKCKHCGMIVGGRTLSVKSKSNLTFINSEDSKEEIVNEHHVKIRKYENWSEHNIENQINILGNKELNGVIYFVSEDEISEIELLGITLLARMVYAGYEGLDIECKVYRANYLPSIDTISPLRYELEGFRTFKASTYVHEYSDVRLNDKSNIVAIEYKCNKRYNKSKWWRFINPRKFHVEYCNEE